MLLGECPVSCNNEEEQLIALCNTVIGKPNRDSLPALSSHHTAAQRIVQNLSLASDVPDTEKARQRLLSYFVDEIGLPRHDPLLHVIMGFLHPNPELRLTSCAAFKQLQPDVLPVPMSFKNPLPSIGTYKHAMGARWRQTALQFLKQKSDQLELQSVFASVTLLDRACTSAEYMFTSEPRSLPVHVRLLPHQQQDLLAEREVSGGLCGS